MNRRSFITTAATLVTASGLAKASEIEALLPFASSNQQKSAAPGAWGQDYQNRINSVLSRNTDDWGEELIRNGGATYENIKDLVQPIWYDYHHQPNAPALTERYGIPWGIDAGKPPWVVAVADGSRIYANNRRSIRFLQIFVGPNADEEFGSSMERLRGPSLEGGFYPILLTEYSDKAGNTYTQECMASVVPALGGIAALIKLSVKPSPGGGAPRTRIAASEYDLDVHGNRLVEGEKTLAFFSGSPRPIWDRHTTMLTWEGSEETIYLAWLPVLREVSDFKIDAATYASLKAKLRSYWDDRLTRGSQVQVPETIAGDALKSTIVSNLLLRFRYSLGSWDYHTDWYPRESCDSLNGLGLHGQLEAYRDGLKYMLGKSWREREFGYMATWGEYMAHGARYFFLSHDAEFIRENTATYEQYARAMQEEISSDPHGIVHQTHRTADIGELGYWTNEEAVCWRGLRDMSEVWRLTGRNDLWQRYSPVAASFRKALRKAVSDSQVRMPDGSLFVPVQLLANEKPYESLWGSTQGSYWNLVFPYAMASGLWDANESDMDGIIAYMRQHGSFFLGLLRFTINAEKDLRTTRPGQFYGHRLDNVYLTGYVQVLADRDDTEHLLLSFYSKLAHGMTRGTFEEGESSSLSPDPALPFRWTNAAPNSTNGSLYLELVRLLLVREAFDSQTGTPEAIYLAYATPRSWMENGKEIQVGNVPTWFGPVAYHIQSNIARGQVNATIDIPNIEHPRVIKLKLRVPEQRPIQSLTINGRQWTKFDPKTEIVDLSGLSGKLSLQVRY